MKILDRPNWDPRFLLPAFIVVNTSVLAVSGFGLLFFAPLVAVAPFVRTPSRFVGPKGLFRQSLLIVLFLGLVVFGHSFEISYSPVMSLSFDLAGLREGGLVAARLSVLYSCAVVFTAVSPGHQTAAAIHWYIARFHSGAADRVYGSVLLVFRFVPRVWELSAETQAAVQMRQCRGIARIRGFAQALVYRVVREADTVAVAAAARNYFGSLPDASFHGTAGGAAVCCFCVLYSGAAILLHTAFL